MAQERGGGGGKVITVPKGKAPVLKPPTPVAPYKNAPGAGKGVIGTTPPKPAPKPAPVAPVTTTKTPWNPQPAPTPFSVADNYAPGFGPALYSEEPAAPVEPPKPKIDPNTEYLNEAAYLAQVSALDRALQDFNSQDTAERGRYDVDYKAASRNLGYRDENLDDDIKGEWDWNDLLTASGRGYQNNLNDFAARGMLESQGYFDAQDALARSLDDQIGAMGTSRQNFIKERNEGLTTYGNQNTVAKNTAAAEAIARLQASLGLM